MYHALGLHLLVSSGDTEKLPREALKYLPTRVVLHLEDAALEMVCGSFEIDPHSAFAHPGRGVLLVGGVATGFQTLNTLMTTDFADAQLAPVSFTALGGAAFPPYRRVDNGEFRPSRVAVLAGLARAGTSPRLMCRGRQRRCQCWQGRFAAGNPQSGAGLPDWKRFMTWRPWGNPVTRSSAWGCAMTWDAKTSSPLDLALIGRATCSWQDRAAAGAPECCELSLPIV